MEIGLKRIGLNKIGLTRLVEKARTKKRALSELQSFAQYVLIQKPAQQKPPPQAACCRQEEATPTIWLAPSLRNKPKCSRQGCWPCLQCWKTNSAHARS